MPQNSTIIPSLFYHLSSSFRVHHYPPIIINAPSFRLNHSYHLSFTTYHHQCAIIPSQSFIPPIIIISRPFNHSSSFRHYFASILPPIIIIPPSFCHYYHYHHQFRLFNTYHHHSTIIPSSFHIYDFHLSSSFRHHSISMISTYHCHFAPYHLSSSLRHLYHYNFAIIPHLLFATYHHSTFIIYHFHNHPSLYHDFHLYHNFRLSIIIFVSLL